MNETPDVQEQVPEGAFMIETIDQFAQLIQDWHSNTVATIKHMIDVPDGMEVVIEGEEPFKMEGEIQRGYKLGLNIALNYLGPLPFGSAPEPDESKPH